MTEYWSLIRPIAEKYRLDPMLVEAIVLTESGGWTDAFRYEPQFWNRYLVANPLYRNSNARRVSSSYGLMQVMLPVAAELGFSGDPEELFKPQVGLDYGCKKLRTLLDWAKGDVDKALSAYNAGQGGIASPAAKRYVAKVHDWLAKVQKHRNIQWVD